MYGPNQVKFDVRKSDSLVSPYTAEIHVAYDDVVLERDTRAEAEAAEVAGSTSSALSSSQSYRFGFAYQDSRWLLQRTDATSRITSVRDMPPSTVEIGTEQLLKQFPEAASCAAAA